jgi:hypothetical protein
MTEEINKWISCGGSPNRIEGSVISGSIQLRYAMTNLCGSNLTIHSPIEYIKPRLQLIGTVSAGSLPLQRIDSNTNEPLHGHLSTGSKIYLNFNTIGDFLDYLRGSFSVL